MKIAGILFVVYVGYRLGRSDLRVHPGATALTVLLAALLHALVRLALPHDGIERIAAAVAWSWWSPVLVGVALVETSGLWIPVLLIRWTALQTRIAASAYIMGAATLGTLAHYQPFEVEIWNGEVIGPTHPAYEVALIATLVIATVPFIIGWVVARRGRTIGAEGLQTGTVR